MSPLLSICEPVPINDRTEVSPHPMVEGPEYSAMFMFIAQTAGADSALGENEVVMV
jgi:hypothetical protein